MKKICILDYGLGNIRSLYNSLKKIGFNPELFSSSFQKTYDFIFLPGVGSFKKGSELLNNAKIKEFLNFNMKNSKIFGICLGMQLLLSKGYEIDENKGLDLIKGEVTKIKTPDKNLILPFVGYQKVKFNSDQISILKKYNNFNFYFVHSFEVKLKNNANLLGITKNNDKEYCAAIYHNNVIGTQFHPEKSGEIGLEFLKDIIVNF
jgi:glutamine amidotransferase